MAWYVHVSVNWVDIKWLEVLFCGFQFAKELSLATDKWQRLATHTINFNLDWWGARKFERKPPPLLKPIALKATNFNFNFNLTQSFTKPRVPNDLYIYMIYLHFFV